MNSAWPSSKVLSHLLRSDYRYQSPSRAPQHDLEEPRLGRDVGDDELDRTPGAHSRSDCGGLLPGEPDPLRGDACADELADESSE